MNMIEIVADILLVTGALCAGLYCFVLARRLSKFNDLESGMGGAVAVLSAQVDDLTETLKSAQHTASASTTSLNGLTDRAETVAKRLELLVASMHDLNENTDQKEKKFENTAPPSTPLGPMFKRHSTGI